MTATPWNYHLRMVVWERLATYSSLDPAIWRIDAHGNTINFHHYGRRDSQYGWELDHWPTPKMFGGTDDPSNMRALHWRSNAIHGGLLGLGKQLAEKDKGGGLLGLLAR